ncbi:1615_t:CDS:1, partial [Scutellospora calospora]
MLDIIDSIADIVKPFLPFVSFVINIISSVKDAYQKAQYNKKTCTVLVIYVKTAQLSIQALIH